SWPEVRRLAALRRRGAVDLGAALPSIGFGKKDLRLAAFRHVDFQLEAAVARRLPRNADRTAWGRKRSLRPLEPGGMRSDAKTREAWRDRRHAQDLARELEGGRRGVSMAAAVPARGLPGLPESGSGFEHRAPARADVIEQRAV